MAKRALTDRQIRYMKPAPKRHIGIKALRSSEARFRHPVPSSLSPPFGDEYVQVAVEVQMAPEGVRDHHDHQLDPVFLSTPLL